VVHQGLFEELIVPALARIGRILEVSGGGLHNELYIQVLRYPQIDTTHQLAGSRIEITQAQLVSATPDDELLPFLEQSLTPVVHNVVGASHRFFYA
jgi:hypothetical protein